MKSATVLFKSTMWCLTDVCSHPEQLVFEHLFWRLHFSIYFVSFLDVTNKDSACSDVSNKVAIYSHNKRDAVSNRT